MARREQAVNDVTADETSTAGDEDFHEIDLSDDGFWSGMRHKGPVRRTETKRCQQISDRAWFPANCVAARRA
jgi:hypothetical protein